MNDGELLRNCSEAGDEKAFRELIERHADMIYSTAFRQIVNAHAAEDVTQAVSCLLLRKAGRLYGMPDLAPWLHRATCWKASEQLRAERRRQFHEHAAAIKAIDPSSPKPIFERDDLLATLRGLSETVAELGPALAPADIEAVTGFIEDSRRFVGQLLKLDRFSAVETAKDFFRSP